MVRIPDPSRFEFRLADGAANPYLMPAAVITAGLDGIVNGTDPGKRLDIDMYTEGHKARSAKTLPLNLLDAIRAMEKNKVLASGLGGETVKAFAKLKYGEWNEFNRHLSSWERENTLDC